LKFEAHACTVPVETVAALLAPVAFGFSFAFATCPSLTCPRAVSFQSNNGVSSILHFSGEIQCSIKFPNKMAILQHKCKKYYPLFVRFVLN
jgi:hypothetical protein